MVWRQTFYTFLLRRVLGPYLSPDSLQQLYKSIDVSLQEGRFSLNDVELNAAYLTSKQNAVSIRYVRIKKLQIRLSLRERNNNDEVSSSPSSSSSVTWRAMNLAREGAGVSLEAHVEINGVEIHVGPPLRAAAAAAASLSSPALQRHESNTSGQQTPAASSTIGSYVDAALAALRLSLDIKNLKLRIIGSEEEWLELDLSSASYRDRQSHDTAMHKSIDFTGITVQTRCIEKRTELIAMLEGGGQLSLKANNVGVGAKLKQDISISLYQRINLSVAESSLRCIVGVVDTFSNRSECPSPSREQSYEMPSEFGFDLGSPGVQHDEQDILTIKDIMVQYAEARQCAERNEVRGGILVSDEGDTMSFDAFFDANELSFSNYRSTLDESIIFKGSAANGGEDYVHTQVKLHLGECRIKVSFPSSELEIPSEYLLLTFGDLSISSAISTRLSSLDFSVGRITAEASQVSTGGRREIETLWLFEQDDDPSSIVSTTPCVEGNFVSKGATKQSVDIRLRGLTLFYNAKTIEQLDALHKSVRPVAPMVNSRSFSSDSPEQTTTVSLWASSIAVLVPIQGVPEATFTKLFKRSGYRVEEELPSISPVVGITLEDFSFSTLDPVSDDIADGVTGQKVSCRRVLVFVSAPVIRGSCETQRVDVLALSGQIPLSLTYIKGTELKGTSAVGESVFPKVPMMSSFKAREDDDDDDDMHGSERSEIMNSLRSADPQTKLIHMARQCHQAIEIKIPDLIVDLAKVEVQPFIDIMKAITSGRSSAVGDRTSDVQHSKSALTNSFAIAVHIDQVTACAHCEGGTFSFKVIGREWKVFAAFLGTKISCLRAMMHEMDLYTAQNLIRVGSKSKCGAISVLDRCDVIRQRTVRNALTKSMPILYRSQLFPPLSPKSPAILLDLIDGSDEECSEWTIHFSIYNITHRCDLDSVWYASAREFFASDQGSDAEPVRVNDDDNIVDRSSLKRIFVTLADCNLDYTSPNGFCQASRTILRISDTRLSSNIVYPPQPVQAFSLSVCDVTLLIGNKRHPYNSENACLSRSVTILRPEDLDVVNGLIAAPDLQQMNLVTMLTLDSFVASISLADVTRQASLRKHHLNDPNLSLNLTFGYLCLYGCKDSFECLAETVGELNLKLTGLTNETLDNLRQKDWLRKSAGDQGEVESDSSGDQRFFDSSPSDLDALPAAISTVQLTHENNTTVTKADDDLEYHSSGSFELDGYDWTTIDHKWSKEEIPAGEEQVARWFPDKSTEITTGNAEIRSTFGSDPRAGPKELHIISHHIQLKPSLNPLLEGDMDAARHAGTKNAPPVNCRTLVRDLKVRCRFFDGYDWPQDLTSVAQPTKRSHAFIIDHVFDQKCSDSDQNNQSATAMPNTFVAQERLERKERLMGALLDEVSTDNLSTFRDVPLPEERSAMLMEKAEQRRLSRRINRFLQVSLSGLQLRIDSFEESQLHRLGSCMDLRVEDFFIAETISNSQPTKMLGEWVNEVQHPRDTKHGLVMMRMVSWHPVEKITEANKVAPQESEAVFQFLPLRCHIYQQAVRFASAFFASGEKAPEKPWALHLQEIPPPLFVACRIKPCKLKVNYTPEKIDVEALRNGSAVELINISPLNDMVILLDAVVMYDKVGFGEVFFTLASTWVQDICSTQLHKFVTNSSAFQPITSVSTGAVDMFVLPWEAVKNGKSVSKAIRRGVHNFAESLVYESLNVGSKLTNVAAAVLTKASSPHLPQRAMSSSLPSRPASLPRRIRDTTDHSIESLAKGLETANYKIIIIPYREYRRSGATGAVASVVRGIPVAVMAPIGAASEAISYTLLGARNQIRPEIRKEEEASQRGLGSWS